MGRVCRRACNRKRDSIPIAIPVYRSDSTRMLAIRLDPEIEARLTRLAEKTGRTKTYYAREAILEHLDDLEDTYLAIERIEKPDRLYSLKEAKRELGL